jgi:uncharacterized membrane protein
MSYQLGGFTVVVPRDAVRDLAIPVEEALRFCVTAGVAHREEDDEPRAAKPEPPPPQNAPRRQGSDP